MLNRVVAHFQDGRLIKGTCFNVSLQRPICHIHSINLGVVPIFLNRLKGLFFVRDLQGDPHYADDPVPRSWDLRRHGHAGVDVRFRDGERIVGWSTTVPPLKPYFFLVPVDNQSNNLRILVNRDWVIQADPFRQ